MADKVYPGESPPIPADTKTLLKQNSRDMTTKPSPPRSDKPIPAPGTYVIQIPKDMIYRVPPPENARRYAQLSRRKPQQNRCCRCLCCFFSTILILILLIGIAAGVLYFVFRPQAPNYTVDSLSIKGFNLTSPAPIAPEFDVKVKASNPNDKIGIYYEKGSSAKLYYHGINLCNGVLPAFYQPTNNVTKFVTALKGSGIKLTNNEHKSLVDSQKKGTVPFLLKLIAPVRIKVGAVKTWVITVKVNCKLNVDKLTAGSKVVSKDCDYGVAVW